jgi:hypothetical protein
MHFLVIGWDPTIVEYLTEILQKIYSGPAEIVHGLHHNSVENGPRGAVLSQIVAYVLEAPIPLGGVFFTTDFGFESCVGAIKYIRCHQRRCKVPIFVFHNSGRGERDAASDSDITGMIDTIKISEPMLRTYLAAHPDSFKAA